MLGSAAVSAAREVQVPILAALLLIACAAKAWHAIAGRSRAPLGPEAALPARLRTPLILGICVAELALAGGLAATATAPWAGVPATIVRSLVALLFGVAMATLNELRVSRPGAGCGCFGELSATPVGWRSMTRSGLLCAAAIASVQAPPLSWPASSGHAGLVLAIAGVELVVIGVLSPEVGQLLARLGYREPCEASRLPEARAYKAMRASRAWRRHQPHLTAAEPADAWREGCWRFAAFDAQLAGRPAQVVFAVSARARRPVVRATIVAPVPALIPPGAALPLCSDAEVLAHAIHPTTPAPAQRWSRPPTPTFTADVVPRRPRAAVHVPPQARRPLASAAPREAAHVHATSPEGKPPATS